MNTNVRPRLRAPAILVAVFFIAPVVLGRPLASGVAQAVPAPALDRVLAANNLDDAQRLVPENWAAAEQLFVSYLERAFITPDAKPQEPTARTRTERLAEVFFRIVESDFAKAIVAALDDAAPAKRRALVDTVRDYFLALERLRASYAPSIAATVVASTAAGASLASERAKLAPQFLDVADRFRALGVRRAELHTLRTMTNLGAGTGPDGLTSAARADRLADELGDGLSLVTKRPFTDASVTMAEKLGLPRRQRIMLDEMGRNLANSTEPTKLEQAAKYLERARAIARDLPPLETVNYWLYPSAAPISARSTLPALWSVYHQLKRPADAEPLVAEAIVVSRAFGQNAVMSTLSAFASRARGLDSMAAETVLQASRTFGPRVELMTLRQLSASGAAFQEDIGQKALALAVTIDDSHERAVTLEWYSRNRQGAGVARPFGGGYDRLLKLCLQSDEVALTADALANQASFQLRSGEPAVADATFTAAMQHADQAADFTKVAQVGYRATLSYGGASLPPADRFEFATRAIAAATKADSPLELARAFRARSQIGKGATHQSFDDLKQALAAAERHTRQSGDAQEELQCLLFLAIEHEMRAEYQAAADLLITRAQRSHESRGPGGSIAEREAYERLIRLYSTKMGEPSLALEAADHLRSLLEASLPDGQNQPGATSLADAYATLARMAEYLGQPVRALEYSDKALEQATRFPPGIQPNVPYSRRSVLTNRARVHTTLGDYEAALSDWAEIARLPQVAGESADSKVYQDAERFAQVAWVHALAGQFDEALGSARQAIVECKRNTKPGTWFGMYVLTAVPDVLLVTGHADEAIALLELSRDTLLGVAIDQPVARRFHLESLAKARVSAGQFDEARSLLQSTVEIDRNHPTGEIGGLGASLLALGKLEAAAGNPTKAAEYLAAAREAVNPYDVDRIWQIERALATAAAHAGNGDAADLHYTRALDTLEAIAEQPRPEEFRLKYGEDRDTIYEEHASLLAARALESGRPDDAARAFQSAERKRVRVLQSLLATGWSRLPPEAVPDQVRRRTDLEARIGAKQALLRDQFDRPADQREPAVIEKLRAEVTQAHDDHARLLASIAQGQYRYLAPASLVTPGADAVQRALGPSRSLVEYLVTDVKSYAFVVSQSRVTVVPLTADRATLRQQVTRLLAPFRKLRSGEVDLARLDFDTATAYALYQALFAPLRPSLGDASNILIVPDDVLTFLPFDVLLERAPQRVPRGPVLHAELANQPFLVRRYAISYLTSSAQLLSSATPADPAPASKSFFAMANPTAARTVPAPAQDDPLKRQLRSGALDAMLAPLPGAQAEVERIARYFPADASTVLTGSDATETAYSAQAGRYRIVHFATHAIPSDGQPLYSTLVLAPDAGAGSDGFLQAYEVLRTPLAADLVVLSGCETALGAQDQGQGLTGLVVAFQQAGAQSVLATLWSIDEAAAEMMSAFYGAMAKGQSASEALRQAKIQFLGQTVRIGGVEVSLAHPFFWAPFKLVGAPAGR